MEVVEEPFISRQAVVNVLSFGGPSTDAPLRTLRRHSALSDGVSVPMRDGSGRMIGRLQLYSALSADAARLYRWRKREAAVRIAREAQRIEASIPGRRVIRAIERSALSVPVSFPAHGGTDPRTQAFRLYCDMRGRASWEGLDPQALWRAWLSEPQTWLEAGDDLVREAVHDLSALIAKARAGEPALEELAVSSRVGVVERLDPVAAEIASPDGTRFIVPRRPLEREGLAVVGQAVSVLLEELSGGRVLDFYAPAARLDANEGDDVDPFGSSEPMQLSPGDRAWLTRVFASEPTVVPLAPVGSAAI